MSKYVAPSGRREGQPAGARPGLPRDFAEEGMQAFEQALRAMGLSISGEAVRVVRAWFDFYATWPGRRVTGFNDPTEAAVKLVADSFAVARLRGGDSTAPAASRGDAALHRQAIDLGSGNGWPGLAVPLLWPSSATTLLDSRASACDFLRQFVGREGIDGVSVLEGRAEEAAKRAELAGRYDLAVTRAMASPGVALELATPFLEHDGAVILWLGPEQKGPVLARPSVAELGLMLDETAYYDLPGGMGKRMLALYKRVSAAMPGYPRKLSAIRAKPLL